MLHCFILQKVRRRQLNVYSLRNNKIQKAKSEWLELSRRNFKVLGKKHFAKWSTLQLQKAKFASRLFLSTTEKGFAVSQGIKNARIEWR